MKLGPVKSESLSFCADNIVAVRWLAIQEF